MKSLVGSWEMLQNEAAVYAENENSDAADDNQHRAEILRKRKRISKKTIKAY